MRTNAILVLVVLIVLVHNIEAWRRRRRRRCIGCAWSSWGSYGSCSATCNWGYKYRSRSRKTGGCGATCSGPSTDSARCYLRCCPVHCRWSWSSWSKCTGCGWSTQTSTVQVSQRSACGGRACPTVTKKTQRCNTGICCPVNCAVSSWGNWGACNAACEKLGTRKRTRTVRTQPSCKGTACPTLTDTKSCTGGCCRRDCLVSTWSAWSKCNAPPGKCSGNSGTRTRSRKVTRPPSCGGSACPTLVEKPKCTPVPISCIVSSWSSFGKCIPNQGNCGPGTKTRTRSIKRQPYCSSACPLLKDTQPCSAGCCPVNCIVSGWSSWSSCTSTCGKGTKSRTRTITRHPSCNGQPCPSLKSTTSCSQYNNKDCVMSSWSSWSQCSNGCGNGWVTKTRKVVSQAVCLGKKCGPSSVRKACTSYRDKTDCVVGTWSSWGACNAKCAVGSRQRTRAITVPKRCGGKPCPSLSETSKCGTANGGCQHTCSNGLCSCRPGYNLASNKKTCTPKDCGKASPRFCAPGTRLNSTCKYAIVTCPGGKTTYPVTCSFICHKYYSLKGTSSITCQTSGLWTSYSSTYCRRNNDPPTQILLSGTSTVAENEPRGTKIGTFSSVDPVNIKDKHTYAIIKGGNGFVELRGADLLTLKTFNFESPPNTFDITVRSTDNGVPASYLDKTFTIKITDVNEAPTDIQLSSTNVNENSDSDTTVGMLSTADPDKSQAFTYNLLDNAGGRFKVVNNLIKVAQSNKLCLQTGGSKCVLNFEQQPNHIIRVRSTDSGSPSKSVIKNVTITLNDVNDKPRDLKLSNQKIKENAPINSFVGQLSASDEDSGQRLVFTLDDGDNGRFKVDSKGRLLKAKTTDYETSKVHQIIVRVTDTGKLPLSLSKKIKIVVLNDNEPPISVTIDKAKVKENSPVNTTVGMLTALDTDANQTLTFKLDDNADGKFALGKSSGCKHTGNTQCFMDLLVSGHLDFEDEPLETIIVRVTDNNCSFFSETVNISVTNVNDKPMNVSLEGSLAATVIENSRDVEIGELQTLDQDIGQTFNYTLLSNGGGYFEVRGSKLYVTKSANLDYEKVRLYKINVRSTDSGIPTYCVDATLVITVTDQNEAPTDITLSNNTVQENQPTGTLIGSFSITDPDNLGPQGIQQTHQCKLISSGNGILRISLVKGVNPLTVGPTGVNFEAQSIVDLIVQCSDPQGLSFKKHFNITVEDVNEAPTKITVSNLNVKENQATPTVIGNISVSDPDNEKYPRQTFTLSIFSSVGSPFVIQNGHLMAAKKLDFESKAQWTMVIHAKDSGKPPKSKVQQFTVQVLDINDPPSSVQISSLLLDENSDQDSVVGTLSTVDQDLRQNFTYACIDCANGRFKINNNELKVAQSNKQCLSVGGSSCPLNYEVSKKHFVNIQSTDDGIPPYSVNTTFYVILRDVNDQPRDLKLSNNKVKENATINTLIGQLSAQDEDSGQSLTFSLADDDGGRFRVDSDGKLFKAKSIDYETQKKHSIRAVVTDDGSPALKMEQVFIIEVLDINEPPVSIQITSTGGQVSFPTNSARVQENSPLYTAIGTLEALDADANQNITFKLDDDGNGTFILGTSKRCITLTNKPGYKTKCSIILKLNGPINYEVRKEYAITIRITDDLGLFTTQQLTISVVDQNDPPTNITLSETAVDENSNGAFIGVLTTTDEDTSQTYVYVLTNDAAGRFDIQRDKLYVSSTANLDFEKQASFQVSIQVKDSGAPSMSFSKNFVISVRDVNEAPTSIVLSNNHVTENSASGTVIGSLNVSDPDNVGNQGVIQSHICNIGGQYGLFVVQNNVLKLGSLVVDFEQAATHDVLVSCTDNGQPALTLKKKLLIIVDDVNETPSNISLSSNTIAENSPPSLVGTFNTADPDNEGSIRQNFSYSFVHNTAGLPFTIDGSALNTTRSLNYEAQSSWTLKIQSTDSGKPAKSVINTFVVYVTDINEAPISINLSQTVVKENSGKDTVIGSLSCQDPDSNQQHTYTITDTSSGRFKVVQNKLSVAISNTKCLKYGGSFCHLNFEAQRQHVIRMRCTDNGVPPQNIEKMFTISVSDVNDRPRDLTLTGYSVKENATIGTRIGEISATDEDQHQILSYKIVDDDNGRFTLDKENYVVKAKNTDYETNKAHVITIAATDNGTIPLTLTKNITISIENINEAPVNTSIISLGGQQTYPVNFPQINENSPTGTVVGTLVSLDHDEVQTLKFTMVDDAAGKFSIPLNGSSSKCQNLTNTPGVKSKCTTLLLVNGNLNYEQSGNENIFVKVTDPNGASQSQIFTVRILDVNDKPSDITLSGGDVGYVDENLNNALVGDLATTDEDVKQSHTYRLINNSSWNFVLRGNKLYTWMYARLDYEKKSVYNVTVRSIDSGKPKLFFDKTFTIKVNDINEKPTDIKLSNLSIYENSDIGVPVGKISVIDPDNFGPRGRWQVHACLIVNNVPFIVNQSTSELVVAGSLNHEVTPTIDVIIRCHDNGSTPLSLEKTVTVIILDVNEAPKSIRLYGSTVAENSGVVTIGRLDTIDPDNLVSQVQTFSYSIIGDTSLPFRINGSSLKTTRSLDYEANSTWKITIQSTDNKGLSVMKTFIISVADRNDPPSKLNFTGSLSIAESSTVGTYVGSVSTIDQDKGQTFTYQIQSVVAKGYNSTRNDSSLLGVFSIGSTNGILTLASPVNFEKYTKYILLVRSVDSGSPPLFVTGLINVQIKDINEEPNNITLSNKRVPENSPVDFKVGSLFVHDPDNTVIIQQHFTCYVTNPAQSPFKVINDLRLVVANDVLDYETQNVYTVSVNCSERTPSTNYSIATTFTIKVEDVNEAPYNLTISSTSIAENGFPGDIVGILNVLDPDTLGSGFANVSISIQTQTPPGDAFKIDNKNLVTARALDFEAISSYNITLVAKDSGSPSLATSITFNVDVLDTNDPPCNLTLASSGVYENSTSGTKVGILNALDQDTGQTLFYSVADPLGGFSTKGKDLLLRNFSLNFEVSPVVNVRISISDNGKPPQMVELPVKVKVLDSNDPPSNIEISSPFPQDIFERIKVPENSPDGTLLANITVVDEDVSQDHSCILKEGERWFRISSVSRTTAEVLVKKDAGLDYETMSDLVITVTIHCTDSGSPPYSIATSFNITVSDVNEPPYNITLSGDHRVQEHPSYGFIIGNLDCRDQDFDQSHVFSVIGNSSQIFEVNKTTQDLIVKDPSKLDYETFQPKGTITVSILATDTATKPLSVSRDFILHIVDKNEAPYFVSSRNVSKPEDLEVGRCIAKIAAKDPDRDQKVTLSLLSYQDTFELASTCIYSSTNESMPNLTNESMPSPLTNGSFSRYLTNKMPLSYDNTLPDHIYNILVSAQDDRNPPLSFNETFFLYVQRVDPCNKGNNCNGNATCIRVNGTSFTCSCNAGFSGDGWNCKEINECDSMPCKYNGNCTDEINGYSCHCNKGFNNTDQCNPNDFCASNPCLNGGTCGITISNKTVFEATYKCSCAPGYNGTNCLNDINECKLNNHPCLHGNCTDGINRFDCSCFEGFTGTLCQRNTKDCIEEGYCKPHQVCVPRNLTVNENEPVNICFDKDFVIPLYFKPEVFSLENVTSPHWQYLFQKFIINNMKFPKGHILNNEEEDNTNVTASDVYVMETTMLSLYPLKNKRVRKAVEEKISYTSVDFVVIVEDGNVRHGVGVDIFYRALNRTCIWIKKANFKNGSFELKICDAGNEMLTRLGIKPYMPRAELQQKANRGLFGLHPYMYYVFIGVGLMLLLLLIIGIALCRRDSHVKRRERAYQTHHELLDNDNLATDVMQRHQLSNEGQGEGAFNPMYGVSESVQPSFAVLDNPLYARPDDIIDANPEQTAFSNPMYQSFKRVEKDKDTSEFETEDVVDDNAVPVYQMPVSKDKKLKEKKKKKKKNKKEGKKNTTDDDDEVPNIASFNPMFANREIYHDPEEVEQENDNHYAVPNSKNEAEDVKNLLQQPSDEHVMDEDGHDQSIYATPKKVKKSEELLNIPYESEPGLQQQEEMPTDILNAFGVAASKRIDDGDTGQSDC